MRRLSMWRWLPVRRRLRLATLRWLWLRRLWLLRLMGTLPHLLKGTLRSNPELPSTIKAPASIARLAGAQPC
jgi:hypothetical protein